MSVRRRWQRLIGPFLLGLSLQSCTSTFNEVILVNGASENIKAATVSIAELDTAVPPLARGEKWSGRLRINHDSAIKVVVEFESGRRLAKEVGSVTNNLMLIHQLTVKDTDIEVDRRRPVTP